jgi:methionyl-tRNA formyltransferase
MRIAFLGLPLAALMLHADGHDVVLAGISRTDAVGLRRAKRLFGPRLFERPTLDATFVALAREAKPDLLVSWYWTNLIPMELVAVAPLGGFGVHPSLLPRHRGPDPTTWAILAGDLETGVSAHRIERDYDTGAVLMQERLVVEERWDAFQLARALDRPSLRVMRAVAAAFARGAPPAEVPQDPSLATAAPFPDDELLAIRWARSTQDILRQIRALAPAPGASTEIGGAIVTVLRAVAAEPPRVLEEPGESVLHQGRCLVRTGDGAVEILAAEVDGEPADRRGLASLFGGSDV